VLIASKQSAFESGGPELTATRKKG